MSFRFNPCITRLLALCSIACFSAQLGCQGADPNPATTGDGDDDDDSSSVSPEESSVGDDDDDDDDDDDSSPSSADEGPDSQSDDEGTDSSEGSADATSESGATDSDASTGDDSDSEDDTSTGAEDEGDSGNDPAYGREVLSWVPPYSVSQGMRNLDANFGSHSPNHVLTALALQFWRPTPSGGLVYEQGITDAIVAEFRAKCDQYKVKLMLCVYNNNQQDPGWDWALARQAFADNRSAFVNALVDEAIDKGLDGVDIDLEGLGRFDADREAFAAFIEELGEKLHENGLILTIDSFHSPCFNAPNMAWWPDWAGYVDHVHSMGYAEIYEGNERTFDSCPSDPNAVNKPVFKYSFQTQYGLEAGFGRKVVSLGMPSSNSWGGGDVSQHLRDNLGLESPGSVCIWDFSLRGSAWQQASTWELLQQIRDLP